MKDLGYGRGYQYAHDFEEQTAAMECLPEALRGRRFYEPKDAGVEAEIRERLEKMRKARKDEGKGECPRALFILTLHPRHLSSEYVRQLLVIVAPADRLACGPCHVHVDDLRFGDDDLLAAGSLPRIASTGDLRP